MPVSEARESDAALLFDAVREAGALGLSLSRRGSLKQWTKPDGSQVTEGDLAINALLEERLKAQRPADGWLSEETPDAPLMVGRLGEGSDGFSLQMCRHCL